MKKKIMHVAQSAGGVYRYLSSFLTYSNRDKYEIILVLSEDYIKYEGDLSPLVDSIEIISMKREISLREDFNSMLLLRKIIKKHQPNLIYAHSSKAGALTRVVGLTNRVPIIYNPHGWAFNMKTSSKNQMMYQIIEKMLAFRTNQIINISEYELKTGLKCNIAPIKKMKLIYNGIDVNECTKHNNIKIEKFKKSEDMIIIGSVGRISAQKSPLDFVNVAHEVSKKIKNIGFIWVGDGEDRVEMETLIKSYDLEDKFFITGWVENPTDYINLFDISLLLSAWEGFGLVLTEYMLYKKPIIATKVDAIPELIEHEVNGFTVNLGDIKAVSDYILTYINQKELATKHANYSYKKVMTKFNIIRVVEEHEKIFKEILGED